MPIEFQQSYLRPATARLVTRLIAPLLDPGTVTQGEFNQIAATMKALCKNSPPPPPLKLLTAQEAADLLGISFSQFRALEKEGAFPFQRKLVGRKAVRYRSSDIYGFILSDEESGDKVNGRSDATFKNV
ncbi:MAG: hypothetical protein IJS08_17125 [Victivallales bacterium]|nr:hypothetical protein [Victivallales bacterium]